MRLHQLSFDHARNLIVDCIRESEALGVPIEVLYILEVPRPDLEHVDIYVGNEKKRKALELKSSRCRSFLYKLRKSNYSVEDKASPVENIGHVSIKDETVQCGVSMIQPLMSNYVTVLRKPIQMRIPPIVCEDDMSIKNKNPVSNMPSLFVEPARTASQLQNHVEWLKPAAQVNDVEMGEVENWGNDSFDEYVGLLDFQDEAVDDGLKEVFT